MWLVFAILSAVFAALTSILAKVGIEGVNSNLATAIRTVVVVGMAWLMVFSHPRPVWFDRKSAKRAGYS
jgi:bacterial/archaeal transporter family protein